VDLSFCRLTRVDFRNELRLLVPSSPLLSTQPLLSVFMVELFFTAGSLLQMKLMVILFYLGSPPGSDPAAPPLSFA
jgi:hypothetical protein